MNTTILPASEPRTLAISVCLPVYNSASYLKDCMDSILMQTFTDFELLIIDDGSTDESVDIIRSYTDKRIKLILCEHDYIANLNRLLKEAKGKYIARMDSDDIMFPYRLQVQFDYMEAHPDVDLLGGGMEYFGNSSGRFTPQNIEKNITLRDMEHGNVIAHPTTMFRHSSLLKSNLYYEQDFIYGEDYLLWVRMLEAGLSLQSLALPLIKYRSSNSQVTTQHAEQLNETTKRIQAKIHNILIKEELENYTFPVIENKGKKLTVIIPFLNEGVEVANTVASIRQYVKDAVDILVINDNSTDQYPYKQELQPYNVYYIFNKERKGVASSRDYGVNLCCTPYFLLLDAHMRFYNAEWLSAIIDLLEINDRQLLCCQTKILWKEEDGTISEKKREEQPATFGAYQPFSKDNYLPDIEWNYKERTPEQDTEDIATVLGAGYAASKRYWSYLRGLQGLIHYGSDEAFISLKVWLEGGRCTLLKKQVIGHVYRKNAPYRMYQEKIIRNNLYISDMLFSETLRCWAYAIACTKNPEIFRKACVLRQGEQEADKQMKEYLESISTVPMEKVLKLHRFCYSEKVEDICAVNKKISEVNHWLPEHLPTNYGLPEGKAGIVLWLFHYAKQTQTQTSSLAYTLIDEIETAVDEQQLPFNFKYGLCGIGWLAIYLYKNKFKRQINNTLLESIDNSVQQLKLTTMTDHSLNLGTAGLLCYAATRLQFAASRGEDFPFCSVFLNEMKQIALHIITQANNVHTCFHAFQYLSILKKKKVEKDWKPQVIEWMDFPNYLPQESMYWKSGLSNGCVGYTLQYLLRTSKYSNER